MPDVPLAPVLRSPERVRPVSAGMYGVPGF